MNDEQKAKWHASVKNRFINNEDKILTLEVFNNFLEELGHKIAEMLEGKK